MGQTALEPEQGTPAADVVKEPVVPLWRLICLSISLCFGMFLSLMDTTIVATSLFTIGVDFDSLNNINWVALSYTLAYLGFAVLFCRVGDIFGRRNAYAAASVIFLVFSLGCGFSQSLNQLIVCRTLQGIGGAGLYSLTIVIFGEVYPYSWLQWIGGLAGAVVVMSGVLGPVLGGVITNYTTWRWVFWINAPIGTIPLVLFVVAWPKKHQLRHSERRPLRELDIVSASLLIAGSVLVVFSLQDAGIRPDSWKTALFIAPLAAGCFCWILLFGWEIVAGRIRENSLATMFPLRLMKNRVYMAAAACIMLTGFPYFVVIYSLSLRFQIVNGKNPLTAGVSLLPMLGSGAIGSFAAGAINSKKNWCSYTFIIATCFMTIGTGLFSTLSDTSYVEAKTYGFEVFMGLGFGLTVSTVSLVAAIECDMRDHAVAQGIVAQVRVLGGSIGIAASAVILGVKEQRNLAGIVTTDQLASLESAMKIFNTTQLLAVRKTYSDAFREDMRVCAIMAGISVLFAIATFQRHPPDVAEKRKQQYLEAQERLKSSRATSEETSESV